MLRSRARRHAARFMLAALVILGSSGCTARAGGPSPQVGSDTWHAGEASGSRPNRRPLRVGLLFTFRSLDPLFNDGFIAGMLDALLFTLLLHTGPDGRLVPEGALVVPSLANGGIAPDGKTITYHLRHDIRWSDGRPFTSSDVTFTFRAILDPHNDVGSRSPYNGITAVQAPDPFTVRVRLARPDASIVGTFFTDDSNYPILPAHLLAAMPDLNNAPFNERPVGSGPYRVTRWDRGRAIELEANPFYFGERPTLERIALREIPDTTTELVQLQTGELDAVVGGDLSLADRYRALPGHRTTNVPYIGATLLMFQTKRPLTSDARVRRAIAASIDRARLAAQVYHGIVTSADAFRGVFSYADDPSVAQIAYDPFAAARIFDTAGWRRGSDGVRERDGHKLELTAIYYDNSAAWRIAAATLQQDLARAGVTVTLKSYTYSQFWAHASDGGPLANGAFDLALTAISSDVDPDVSWLLRCRESAPHGFDQMRYCNADVDASLDEALRALDPGVRERAVSRVEKLVAREVPFLALWQTREIDVVPNDLRGFTPNGTFPFDSARRWAR